MLETFEVSKVLIIAPLRVARDTWPTEIEKWDHLQGLDISVIVGDTKTRIAALHHPAMIYVINRENIKWLVEYYEKNGMRWDFGMVVIDELSSFKNYQSQRFKYLRKVRPYVKRWVGLTGTPSSNGLMDLWAEIGILDGGERLGKFIGRYREAYFKASSMNPSTGVVFQYKPREGAEELIYQRISDITISMKALDYLHMPDCIPSRYEVEMSAPERELYDMLRKDLLIPLKDGDIDAANAASLTGKLLQMSNGAVYDENGKARVIHDHKLEALEDLIEAANGQPVLVAYWFKHDRQRIMEHLAKQRIPVRDIKSSTDIRDWNAGNIPVALIHPAEESDYRYKKSKPVTAMKAKRDEEGFFIPWAMFRPIGDKGLLCELFGTSPIRRAADLRLNRDLLMKEAYEHEVEVLMCHIRASELWMQQEFCKEEQAMELYQKSKIQNVPKLTPDGKRKILLDAVTWKYDCVQQYKKICFQFAEAVIARDKSQNLENTNREHFIEQFRT